MTREPRSAAIDAVPAAGAAGGLVLRGVLVGREVRTLARPRSGAAASLPQGAAERATYAATPPAVVQFGQADTAQESPVASEQYQERGRGFQAGHEEGHHQGHAEGKALGEEQGRREGREAGFEEGRQAAQQAVSEEHAAARQAVADRIARLDALLAGLPSELDRRMGLAEEDLLGLCFDAVARIVGAAAASADGTRAIVLQALQEAKLKQVATVRVNPRDLDALRADPEIDAWLGAGRRVQWLGDDGIALGGCVVVAPGGGLDARLETQLARLARVFSEARRAGMQ